MTEPFNDSSSGIGSFLSWYVFESEQPHDRIVVNGLQSHRLRSGELLALTLTSGQICLASELCKGNAEPAGSWSMGVCLSLEVFVCF